MTRFSSLGLHPQRFSASAGRDKSTTFVASKTSKRIAAVRYLWRRSSLFVCRLVINLHTWLHMSVSGQIRLPNLEGLLAWIHCPRSKLWLKCRWNVTLCYHHAAHLRKVVSVVTQILSFGFLCEQTEPRCVFVRFFATGIMANGFGISVITCRNWWNWKAYSRFFGVHPMVTDCRNWFPLLRLLTEAWYQ